MYILILLCVIILLLSAYYMCPHTTICVLILLYMCPIACLVMCVCVCVMQNEKHNARLSDKDDRKDLQRYYQTLTPKTQLLRQRVMSQELKATQHATLAHKQAEAARERELSLLLMRCLLLVL